MFFFLFPWYFPDFLGQAGVFVSSGSFSNFWRIFHGSLGGFCSPRNLMKIFEWPSRCFLILANQHTSWLIFRNFWVRLEFFLFRGPLDFSDVRDIFWYMPEFPIFAYLLKILPWLFRFFMISARFSGYTWSERLFQPMPNFFRFLKFLPWPGRRSFRERICRVRPEFLYLRRALSDFWSTFRFFWCPRYFPNFLGKVEFFYLRRVFPDFWRFFRRPFW